MSGNDSINQDLLDKILKPAFEDNGRNLPELSNETIEKLKGMLTNVVKGIL